jgi:DNA-directed RNA polymerase specialized sigma24 family protein
MSDDIKVDPEKAFYVSNIRLYEEYIQWYADIETANLEGIEEPPIPSFIVDSMMRIANRLTYKRNFILYTFKDDMVSDALYDCIRFAKKFNPEKSKNPFSYITTISFYAFLRRIDKEKTQRYIKAKIVAETCDQEFFDSQAHEDTNGYANQYIDFLREVGYSEDSAPMSVKRTKKYKESLAKNTLEQFESK